MSSDERVIGGRWKLGPLVAVTGSDGVQRCPYCGEPCSYIGHKRCRPRFQDEYDRGAERRYESWLESLKDHGP